MTFRWCTPASTYSSRSYSHCTLAMTSASALHSEGPEYSVPSSLARTQTNDVATELIHRCTQFAPRLAQLCTEVCHALANAM